MLRGTRLLLGVLLGACKQEEQPPVVYYPAPTSPSTNTATPTPGGVPAPSAAGAPAMAPAFGFFCATDQDAQCPYARCVGGRCGGCSSQADCKANTQCLPSFVGQVCLPGAAPAPPPATAPTASPAQVPAATPAAPAAPAASAPFERARALCVQRTNEYRARVGVGPVTRRADAEACGDAEAAADGASRTAHGAFGRCRERAQNECPGWDGDPETVIDRCLAMMFAEGPGAGPAHGHYVNMTDAKYRGVSCGFASTASGLWVVQNFYP